MEFWPRSGFWLPLKFSAFLSFPLLWFSSCDANRFATVADIRIWKLKRWVNYVVLAGGWSDCQKQTDCWWWWPKFPNLILTRDDGADTGTGPGKLNNDGKIPPSLESDDAILTFEWLLKSISFQCWASFQLFQAGAVCCQLTDNNGLYLRFIGTLNRHRRSPSSSSKSP